MQKQDFPQHAERPPQPRYPLTEAAQTRRANHDRLKPYVAVALAIAIVIAGIGVFIVLSDNVAARAGAADTAPVPSAQPGPPVPQPVHAEQAPSVSSIVTGDGTWLIGKDIKRGTYKSEGGEWCFWERLRNLSGDDNGVMSKGFVKGPQFVAMGPDDVAFSSQGCGQWVMIP